jgi:hypothetical protein
MIARSFYPPGTNNTRTVAKTSIIIPRDVGVGYFCINQAIAGA